jgi:hypothetical protein
MQLSNNIKSAFLLFMCVILFGCAAKPQLIGSGFIKSAIPIKKQDLARSAGAHSTSGAEKGALGGAAVGVATGAVAGLATGPFAVIVSPVLAVAGGVAGAVVGGVGGGIGGAIYGYKKGENQVLYSYAVKNTNDGKLYLIHQYTSQPIDLNTYVNIFKLKGNLFYIKKN